MSIVRRRALALVQRPDERLTPLERLEVLCDPGSLHLLRTAVRSPSMGDKARDGDGVVGATGTVDGRPVALLRAGLELRRRLARRRPRRHDRARAASSPAARRCPVVGFVESAGARLQEGLAALAGYGRIFRDHTALSGLVPQISIVCGASAGGGSYAPALTDFVVMTRGASMFLTGPGVVREVMGEDVDADALGGPRVHGRNGVCHLVAETRSTPRSPRATCSTTCPSTPARPCSSGRACRLPGGDPGTIVPGEHRSVYDVRDVAARIVDGGRLLEVGERWARNVVTAFARLDGRAVGDRRQPAAPPRRRARRRVGRRRPRASCAPATRSGCRSSSSSTRPASCPAPARRRPA